MDPVLTLLRNLFISGHAFLYQQWLEHPYHIVIEALMIIFTVFILFQKSYRPSSKPDVLSPQEVDELVEDWQPEPLVPPSFTPDPLDTDIPTLTSAPDASVSVRGAPANAVNLASLNLLGLASHPRLVNASKTAIRKYGVGSCGPRGFYGTIDVHVDFEQRVRRFLDAEDAILYSYGFATIASAIPTFSKRGDLLVVDESVNFSVRTGVNLSRSNVRYFRHNDIHDLERVLQEVTRRDGQDSRKPLERRFIVIEGLYLNRGDVAPLQDIVRLKDEYRFRLIMDDSYGFGALGATGRGTCEHTGVPVRRVDLMTANMEAALGCVGGFCVGAASIVSHQRLAASGYVFSASLPPFLSVAASEALEVIDEQPALLQRLRSNATLLADLLTEMDDDRVMVEGEAGVSPILHLRILPLDRPDADTVLQRIVEACLSHGVALTRAKYSRRHDTTPYPSIRIAVSSSLQEDAIREAAAVIRRIVPTALDTAAREPPADAAAECNPSL
eukprot:gb/GECH01012547.1/.p1 GENE.gb/GECH01012547.1/~~gb/GECH01012547.1/.p1  ORF type:complete len:500 (+),score=134.55 gb/GECH01012547.1/:1-1500(+)